MAKAFLSIISAAGMLCCSGCLPSNSTTFESARMLEKNALEIQATGSVYAGYRSESRLVDWGTRTSNLGITAAYGLSDKTNIRVRYEHIKLIDRAEFVDGPLLRSGSTVTFSEVSAKFRLFQADKKTRAAATAPVGLLVYPGGASVYLAPAIYMTYCPNDKFEVGMNGKAHFWLDGLPSYPWVSLGLGFGISNDLNRWALRPEVGWDLFNFSFGLGLGFVFR